LWLIKVWFSASTFVVKIATFAKPETVNSGLAEDFDPEEHLKMLKARPSVGQVKRK